MRGEKGRRRRVEREGEKSKNPFFPSNALSRVAARAEGASPNSDADPFHFFSFFSGVEKGKNAYLVSVTTIITFSVSGCPL